MEFFREWYIEFWERERKKEMSERYINNLSMKRKWKDETRMRIRGRRKERKWRNLLFFPLDQVLKKGKRRITKSRKRNEPFRSTQLFCLRYSLPLETKLHSLSLSLSFSHSFSLFLLKRRNNSKQGMHRKWKRGREQEARQRGKVRVGRIIFLKRG